MTNRTNELINCPYINKSYRSHGQMIANLRDNSHKQQYTAYSLNPKFETMELINIDNQKLTIYEWGFVKREGTKYYFRDDKETQWIMDTKLISLTRTDGTHISFILEP